VRTSDESRRNGSKEFLGSKKRELKIDKPPVIEVINVTKKKNQRLRIEMA
jgi:hypothetical protein